MEAVSYVKVEGIPTEVDEVDEVELDETEEVELDNELELVVPVAEEDVLVDEVETEEVLDEGVVLPRVNAA